MAPRRDDLEILRTAVRNAGLRATPSRIAVLRLLRAAGSPVSHSDVVAELASQAWDPATIYRNLTDLSNVGLARRTDVGDHVWRYEAITAGHQASAHPHFVCTECGSVECLPELDYVITRARTPRAVRLKRVEVQLRGPCDACL
ncbi:MAG TPA: transcriptional repressor [Kofleriaceae bacterium]|jgi:Fur family ferric uptake transcriptional regulator|nr:transcriptional repressor [Kofleriaceae bacterium]